MLAKENAIKVVRSLAREGRESARKDDVRASMATSYAQFLAISLLERGASPTVVLPAIGRKSIRSGDRIAETCV